ncbi:hypothetical protein H6G11_10045 [Cyanobacterium aponinum FACHB-4101]|uniref:hypothetical protein n=1 Tax=Cyanobacterium aponinum TaxID=379064 RepID=UPI0016816B5E|nr:hypothetical protein [Cyanobacterium aponinum]MBD2394592.1 hypothetical protein [Cyanobacterium aponinum FACHB-4101]
MEFLSHHRGIVHLIKRLIYLGITLIDIATKCDAEGTATLHAFLNPYYNHNIPYLQVVVWLS